MMLSRVLAVALLCVACASGARVPSPSISEAVVPIGNDVFLSIVDDGHKVVDARQPDLDSAEVLARLDAGSIVSRIDGSSATILWLLRSCEKTPTMVIGSTGSDITVDVYRGESGYGISNSPNYITACANDGHAHGVTLTFAETPQHLDLQIQDGSPSLPTP